jgi:hypothetical protein
MKKYFFLLLFFFAVVSADALTYFTGIGPRFGKFNSGLSFKHFYAPENKFGLEFDAYYTNIPQGGYTIKGFGLTQYRLKVPIIQIPLDLILGGGVHMSYFPFRENSTEAGYYYKKSGQKIIYGKNTLTVGVDATVQLEYKIPLRKVPITLTIDCNPFYEFVHRGPETTDFGLAIRYVFR